MRNFWSAIPWIGLAFTTVLLATQNSGHTEWQLVTPAQWPQRTAHLQNASDCIKAPVEDDPNVDDEASVPPEDDGKAKKETWPVSRCDRTANTYLHVCGCQLALLLQQMLLCSVDVT